MTAVHVSVEKATHHTPVWLTARLTVPRGLGRRQLRRVRVNDLSSLYPESEFRIVVFRNAERFVQDMAKQGYDLLTAEADVRVTGPLAPYKFNRGAPQQAERHVLSGPGQHRQPIKGAVAHVVGSQQGDNVATDQEDYIIEAQFIARRIRMVEHKALETPGAV